MLAGCGGGSSSGAATPLLPASPLSGVIAIEANSRVDQDTMDQLGLGGATPAVVPQTLPASFVLAGYVSNASGFYSDGSTACQPLEYRADPLDDFLVPMAPGETIVLQSFGTCANAAVLELDVEGALSQTGTDSVGVAKFTLSAGDERDYRVRVRNLGRIPARYVLLKTAGTSQDTAAFYWPDHRFVEGEAIITLAETQLGPMSVMAQANGVGPRRLADRAWLASMAAASKTASAGRESSATLAWIQQLRQTPGVESAAPNYQVVAHSPVSEPLYNRQWHYDLINGPIAWQLAPGGGSGVNVAVLDSGLFRDSPTSWHPDLQANVAVGYDFVDGDAHPDPEDPGNSVGGNVFHGTHVAGTIASVIDGSGSGGVAFGSSLLPVRVLGEGGTGSSADLIAAISWLVNGPAEEAPLADVVNMSLGGLPEIAQLESVIAAGVDKGMIFVAAAGNSATTAKSYPAASPNVLAVSAVDGAGNLATYSNYGSWIDLAAPGGDAGRDANSDGEADLVWSTSATQTSDGYVPDYRGLQGTSMAAPHVAGVLALMKSEKMKSENQQLTYGEVLGLLRQGEMTDYSGSPSVQLGYGVLDAAKAVSAATNGFSGVVLSASPAVLSLSNEGTETQSVMLDAYGSASLDSVSLSSFPEWLAVTEDFSQLPYTLQVTLLRSRLEPDVPARDDIVITYNGTKELRIPVIGQLITDEQARNAGAHFVLLVNTEPDADGFYWAEAQVTTTVENGQYPFRFEADDGEEPRQLNEVVPGDYYLVAGTDIDGDGFICQPGESCAEYPVSGLREVITISAGQSISDVRMTTGFSRPTISAATPDVLPRPDFKGYRLKRERNGSAAYDEGVKVFQ